MEWDNLRDEGTELPSSTTGPITKHVDRVWLYNPLHDYESAWWVAVWFVFSSKPEGVTDTVMKKAYDKVYHDRTSTFLGGMIAQTCASLPPVLQPLGDVLVKMRNVLVDAYQSFEDSFDGSETLLVFGKLAPYFLELVVIAEGLSDITPTIPDMKLKTAEAEFDAATVEEGQGQQPMEQKEEAGEQPMAIDDPSVGAETGRRVLGKRARGGSPSQVDRALKRKKFDDEQTVELYIL